MPSMKRGKEFNLDEIRRRMEAETGPRYWRSLQELACGDSFEAEAQPEAWTDSMDRRTMLKLIGASLSLAGLTACSSRKPEKIVPYVIDPEGLVPGQPIYYATAMPLAGYGKGVLVESHLGRPVKVEGNPRHPASLGGTDIYAQASTYSLYDPDRSQAIRFEGRISSWTAFSSELKARLEEQARKKGAGLRILTGTVTSPTFIAQMQAVQNKYPESAWVQYEPCAGDGAVEGSRMAFGRPMNTCYRIADADVILSLDSDFLTQGPAWLRYSREWASRRKLNESPAGMNRLYVVESTPTCTGVVADHQLSLRASEIRGFAGAVARALGMNIPDTGDASRLHTKWIESVAGDLMQRRGSGLVIAGESQPGPVHALAHTMNQFLWNANRTAVYTDPVEVNPGDRMRSLHNLVSDMRAGKVDLLLIMGGNPAFTIPADLDFSGALRQARMAVHLGLHYDETAERCVWHIPETHYLEAWSDVRSFDGTASIVQPLIAPLYDNHTSHEILAILQEAPDQSSRDIVRSYWQSQHPGADFENFWHISLQSGVIPDTAFPFKTLNANMAAVTQASAGKTSAIEIVFRPDPSIFDGQFANNGWLQELPKPLTKLTWENAAIIGPRTAGKIGINTGDLTGIRGTGQPSPVIELKHRGRSVQAPVYVMPGHPENSVTIHYGYGRTRAGKLGSGRGFNAYLLRDSNAPEFDSGVEMRLTGETAILATTQFHFTMAGRDLVRSVAQEQYRKDPKVLREGKEAPSREETLYHAYEWPYREHKWAMTVDLGGCIGCNACVVACAVENNTPVLGKEQVGRQREMNWLRIDRYYTGDPEKPATHFQPVYCMHCELAPCELVCPVQATNHNSEGLNQMVYNRCVGTRFCSHNCPYKVRRFNFLQYSDYVTPSQEPLYNPDVTVRSRGVMEKCTYCIQRIEQARITASKENRKVRDGEIITACQQACPTRVFTFGDLNDSGSAVARSAADPLNYGLLAELNTRPRTTYLAAMTNRSPELEGAEK